MSTRSKTFRKLISLTLAMLLILQSINLTAFAAETYGQEMNKSISKSGFTISAEWNDSEFKNGNEYNLSEDESTSNAVKLQISYVNNKVSESGYKPGDLIIVVKGIGDVGRDKKLEAVVGADKETVGTKSRDWSYTWNKATDTYIFTNNNEIRPNSVLSGYFELVWNVPARESKEGYLQSDIRAELMLPGGESVYSDTLSFTNDTACDEFQVDIDLKDMYSYEGLTSGITNPDEYAYYKYQLDTNEFEHSRGLKEYKFVFDLDVNNIGSGAVVISSDATTATSLGDGTYKVTLPLDNLYAEDYIYVAYPISSYKNKTVAAGLSLLGVFYEGDDAGNINEKLLAFDEAQCTIPNDFRFTDIPGDIYGYWKDTWHDKFVKDEVTLEKGGDISGRSLVKGTTQTFYLEGTFNKPLDISGGAENTDGGSTDFGSVYTFEMVDDFLYILKNGGQYRQLESSEYDFKNLIIPSTASLSNINNKPIEANKYPVKVYAFYNGEAVNIKNATPIYSGKISTTTKKVTFSEGTSAVVVVIEDLDVSISSFSIPVEVNFHIKDTSDLDWEDQDNLTSGKVENTTFIKLYQDDRWLNDNFTEENYIDDTNLNLAKKDLALYGSYLDREKDSISLYSADKSDYEAYMDVGDIKADGKIYTSKVTMGADFAFSDDEIPDKFSLYTLLPADLSLRGYDIEEDIFSIFKFSGLNLSETALAKHAEVDINENYNDSGRTFIGIHFDFTGMDIPHDDAIRVSFVTKVSDSFFENNKSVIMGRSVVLIDKEIYEYELDKNPDNGTWDDDSKLSSDIDNDGNAAENLSYDSDWANLVYADSSELQMNKSVKAAGMKEFVQLPQVPYSEMNAHYTYELSIRNGASISKNIVLTEILETGPNSQWKGKFNSIDISSAEAKGLLGTIWYCSKTNPGKIGGSDWSLTMEPDKVKAVAVDFGESELKEGEEINIYIDMIAPTDASLVNKITENSFSASFTMVDKATGNEIGSESLDSNFVQVKLASELKTLIINKVDEQTGEVLSGATFALIEESSGNIIAEDTSNAIGQVIFKRVPSGGSYILRELSAPEGYKLCEDVNVVFDDTDKLTITLSNARKTGTALLFKTNALDNLVYVAGAEYGLFTEDGEMIDSAVTDINGRAQFTGIAWGKYYIQEIAAPLGYKLDTEKHSFEITKKNVDTAVRFDIQDEQNQYTSVKLHKYEMTVSGVQTSIPIPGAAFKLFNVTGGRETTLGIFVTDANGEIFVEDLPYGNYRFIETRIPAGFEKVQDAYFSVSPTNPEPVAVAYNKRESGTITIYKTDTAGNNVEGAVFELYDSEKANVLGTYETDEAGIIVIRELDWGTYYLKEKSAPNCYYLNEEWFEAVLDKESKSCYHNVVNETKKGSVILTKTDEIGIVRLAGAEFNLYSQDGSLLQEGLVTDENGQLRVDNLEWGSYYFKETKAPLGYSASDESIRFSVNSITGGLTQGILVSNPQDSKMITITKKILASDINFDNGDPTFLFRVVNESDAHTYHRIIRFDEAYVIANTDSYGYVSQSVTVSDIPSGTYIVSEEETSRYATEWVTGSVNTTTEGDLAFCDITESESAEVEFTNKKYEYGDFSDNESLANILKASAKLTALKVEWFGEYSVEARSEIDKNLVKATAVYDDGSVRVLGNNEWFFGEEFTGSKFPNINGIYDIPVSYSEKGITKTGYFTVSIYGMVKEVVAIEASVKDEYKTVLPGDPLSLDMFNATAVYGDGSRAVLNTQDKIYTTVTSPNYPSNYPDNMTEEENFWEVSYPDASALKIVFSSDSKLESANYDWVSIYDINGDKIGKDLGGTAFAGTEVTVNGTYVKLAMNSDYSTNYKGFSANIYPLDESGNIMTVPVDIVIDRAFAPDTEGAFNVEISLSEAFADYQEGIKTSVTMLCELPKPILIPGMNFKTAVPTAATSVVFTDEKAPSDGSVTIKDLSDEKNMTVVGWLDGTTFKVSSQRTGVKVIGNETCYSMFDNLTTLTFIDVNYLDTSGVTMMASMFNSAGRNAATFEIRGLDTWNVSNVTNMNDMFAYAGENASTWSIGDLSRWDTSSVEDMMSMFSSAGVKTSTWSIGDISQWDVSSVDTMLSMFYEAGMRATDWSLDVTGWDTSSVTYMHGMFKKAGYYSDSFEIKGLDTWKTTSVTNINGMFQNAGRNATEFKLDLSGWDVDLVTDISDMFRESGFYAETWEVNLTGWDVKSVTDMSYMFYEACSFGKSANIIGLNTWKNLSSVQYLQYMFCDFAMDADTCIIGDLSGWDVSKVTNFTHMFEQAGRDALSWSIGDISGWNVGSVTNMSYMFNYAGAAATDWSLDLSGWNVANVTSYTDFNRGVTDKIVSPVWA